MKILLGVLLLVGMAWAGEEPLDQCVSDPGHATYRMFQTKNIWTFLKLDTRTGQVWQVQWGDSPSTLAVNKIAYGKPQTTNAGRFTLCPTKNIFNFVLLDQEDGRMWDVQWSQEEKSRYTVPIFFVDPAETATSASPQK